MLPDAFVSTTPHPDVIFQSISSITTAAATEISQQADINSLGRDIFTFLLVSVVVVPLFRALNVTPVLGFLAVGCLIGPYGLGITSNTEADIQLGDFGILFLLFNEGLSLSPERIKELGRFTGLGVVQLLINIALIFIGTFWGGPVIVNYVQEMGIPLDVSLLRPLFENPVESFCIAAAGALSSSAFVLPVLKQKKWESKPEGVSGLSILLLQDLAVAPLLVIIPLIAGSGPSSSTELGLLVAKATLGFGFVLVVGSYILRYVFEIVAAARSTETFVAAVLLVAVGMGQAAENLGLSASTGAFAAGVLLASNRFRAQIQADIKPFEGILLGIFFITAGADLDPALVLKEWPTLVTGIFAFIFVKSWLIFACGPTFGLTKGQAARVAFTLSGGGEFALVLFQLAQDLGVLPNNLAKLLTASVIISMSLTPLLGEVGSFVGSKLDEEEIGLTASQEVELFEQIDKDNSGSIELEELRDALLKLGFAFSSIAEVFSSFDTDGDGRISKEEWTSGISKGYLADALNAQSKDALSKTDIRFSKDAVIICGYGELGRSLFSLLKVSGGNGAENGGVVCFDLNPSRVTSGVLSGAPVVFGDAAKLDLLKASGVTQPRAVIITISKSHEKRMDATSRLRAALPVGTPIYVYCSNSRFVTELLDAGATDVVCDNVETILRFSTLVGASSTLDELRTMTLQSDKVMASSLSSKEVSIPGLSKAALDDLMEELLCTPEDVLDAWSTFDSLANGRESVPIVEIKEMLLKTGGNEFEFEISRCLSLVDLEEDGTLTFVEFLRSSYTECDPNTVLEETK